MNTQATRLRFPQVESNLIFAKDPVTIAARIAYEANRGIQWANGELYSKSFTDLDPEEITLLCSEAAWARDNPEAPLSASHGRWMQTHLNQGWKYGPVKDPELKTHPCLVPYSDLPKDQYAKDAVHRMIVIAASIIFAEQQEKALKVIEVGDIVSLRSGGPDMSVSRMIDSPEGQLAEVRWYSSQTGCINNDSFQLKNLVKVR